MKVKRKKLDRDATIDALVDTIMSADGMGGFHDEMLEDALMNGRVGFKTMTDKELRAACEQWQIEPEEQP